ncbi:MAG: SIMPL domain-containing protein [Gammaproteobacteria bacterium]|nr:SIMPL domain-containing protein [Gammaproteobacteria bacterium]
MSKIVLTGLVVSLFLAQATWADSEKLHYNQVNLSATASDEIKNDILVAMLYAQEEGRYPNNLADRVNEKISKAVEKAKQQAEIKVQTLAYRTNPYYKKQKIAGWRVRQSIRLESKNFSQLSQLIGDLQESLALEQVSYQVSLERRAEAENRVITKAITAFKERAGIISQQLGFVSYKLIDVNVNTSGGYPVMQGRMSSEMYAKDGLRQMAAPTLEGGTQTIQVNINGRVELQ